MAERESRLEACGWSSFDPELFLKEPGRKARDVSRAFVRLLADFAPGRRVLELCCGAGALAIALARAGYEVTGVDLHPPMLEAARRALSVEEPAVRERLQLVQADVCALSLGDRFDFILLEDDSFMYLLEQEEQLACLEGVRRHLTPDGFFYLQFETPQRELTSDEEFTYDPVAQIRTVKCAWSVAEESGERSILHQGTERRRLTYPCELELLLRSAGLEGVHRWGHLETRAPFTDPDTEHYCYLTRRG